ncbi:alpha/beta fold hydrolase [Amaricoccus solimangrovi]|uniref:Alpha/beta fold hydrolase n=1 Tax=Amaricoccus solimangrovi TaxID=2589815 RepID=A0A501WY19_9RHOB|nr:alpha/beta fold hydrolase [Amaricoccus solimangrovi]TPE50806.1 alpha/beta fold hydrolase [Amaricoccus solimangrovi]
MNPSDPETPNGATDPATGEGRTPAPRRSRRAAPPPATGAREKVVVEGVPIAFRRLGRGPAVALIHGASANLNDMTFRLAPALAARHTVIAFDRPGHGESGWPARGGESLAVQARLLRGALERVGLTRAYLIGHSYGGAVALAWALDAPRSVAGLLLVAAPSHGWRGSNGLANTLIDLPVAGPILARALRHLVPERLVNRLVAGAFAPQAAPEGYARHLDSALVLRPETLRRNARQLAALRRALEPMVPRYPGLVPPLEIVHGDADPRVSLGAHAQRLAAAVPGARLTRLAGIGHMPHQVALPETLGAFARLRARA